MDDSAFEALSRRSLSRLEEAIEQADGQGLLEVDGTPASLAITLPDGRQYLLNAHAPSRQLWLASPVSGGLHFSPAGGRWLLPDGRDLYALLAAELAQATAIPFDFGEH